MEVYKESVATMLLTKNMYDDGPYRDKMWGQLGDMVHQSAVGKGWEPLTDTGYRHTVTFYRITDILGPPTTVECEPQHATLVRLTAILACSETVHAP